MFNHRLFTLGMLLLLAATIMCAAPHTELSILSFNIRYGTADDGDNVWQNRKELVYKVIQDQNADAVGLQEALKFQIDAILEQAPAYALIGVGRDDGDSLGEYSAILYKKDKFNVLDSGTFWFSDTPDVIASTSWGNDITRICTWALLQDKASQKSFYYYNLHLDHRSQPSREKSMELLMQKISNRETKVPFFISGDFNAAEDNPAITLLTNVDIAAQLKIEPIVDSFRVLHPDVKQVGTFGGFKGDKGENKIDYIFVPAGTPVIKAEIIYYNKNGRYPSDHYPVSALVKY